MKKIIAIILALAMFTTMVAAAGLGDVDGDGAITVSDALKALRIAAGIDAYAADADVDSDGSVTVADALHRSCAARWALSRPKGSPATSS